MNNNSEKPGHYFTNIRPEMLAFIPVDVQCVLDVGCGEGLFGESVKHNRNAKVWGIELDGSAGAAAQTRIDEVFIGTVEQHLGNLPDGQFDCVIFNDILEHLVDPYSILLQIKDKLTTNGVVVCSIPNVRHFRNLYNLIIKKQWEYEDSGILDRTHLRFFTEKSIVDMFDTLGFEIVKMHGIQRTNNLIVRATNVLSIGFFSDSLYMQFGCLVKPK